MYSLFISIIIHSAQKYSNSSTSLIRLSSAKWLFLIGCCCLSTIIISINHHLPIISIPSFKNLLILLLKLFRFTTQAKLVNHSNILLTSLISIIYAINFNHLSFIKYSHNHNWSLISFLLICPNYAKKYHRVSFKRGLFTVFLTFINTYLFIIHLNPHQDFLFYPIFLILRCCHFY